MAAQLHSLGRVLVPTGGVPVALPIPPAIDPPTVHAFVIEVLPSNTGKIYVGLVGLNRSTLAECLIVLPVPTANLLPTFSVSVAIGANPLRLDTIYLDADTNNDGVLISAVVC